MTKTLLAHSQKLILALLACTATHAQSLAIPEHAGKFLGVFSNVQVSAASRDCGGFSANLWIAREKHWSQASVVGFFYDAGGTCPGHQFIIAESSYDPRKNSLGFIARSLDDPKSTFKFTGRVSQTRLTGELVYVNQDSISPQIMGEVQLRRMSVKTWQKY
jgi:hypothetical protein